MKVLVDSSIWIEYFRNGNNRVLDRLIEEDLLVINELILTELVPALEIRHQKELIESLHSLANLPLRIDWEIIRRYKVLNLKNGINKVGIPDLIILQQVIEENLTLFTLDNHFKLMQSHLTFKLL